MWSKREEKEEGKDFIKKKKRRRERFYFWCKRGTIILVKRKKREAEARLLSVVARTKWQGNKVGVWVMWSGWVTRICFSHSNQCQCHSCCVSVSESVSPCVGSLSQRVGAHNSALFRSSLWKVIGGSTIASDRFIVIKVIFFLSIWYVYLYFI